MTTSNPSPRARFDAFCNDVEAGRTVEAIDAFYADDVLVFENRKLARAGKQACHAYEREQLAAQPQPPSMKILARAFDEATGRSFIEYDIRFVSPSGRPLRLEEVVVQHWSRGKIDRERYYYQGFVDEGDDDGDSEDDSEDGAPARAKP